MRLVPLPCNYVADGLEANLLLNVKNYPALHCDIHTTIERTELDDPDAVGKEVRTERGMKEVRPIQAALPCNAMSAGGSGPEGRARCCRW